MFVTITHDKMSLKVYKEKEKKQKKKKLVLLPSGNKTNDCYFPMCLRMLKATHIF